jgi:ElaB/YqjD/DUF883 family membrane-anchored ribosome-binding protein
MAYSSPTANDFENKARNAANTVAGNASDLADMAGETIGKVVEQAETTVRNLADRGSEAGEQVNQVAGHIKSAIDKSVRDQPIATLVVAAAIGFTLGALWKS